MTLRLLSALLLASFSLPALAGEARCFTTDDGEFPCWFEALDDSGSFEISGDDVPTFQVWIDAPGVASASAIFEPGGRAIALPGTYYRSEEDRACWVSDATDTEICAW